MRLPKLSCALALVALVGASGCASADRPGHASDGDGRTLLVGRAGAREWRLLAVPVPGKEGCVGVREEGASSVGQTACDIPLLPDKIVNAAIEQLPSGNVAVFGVVDAAVGSLAWLDHEGRVTTVAVSRSSPTNTSSARWFALVAPFESVRSLRAVKDGTTIIGLLAEKLAAFTTSDDA